VPQGPSTSLGDDWEWSWTDAARHPRDPGALPHTAIMRAQNDTVGVGEFRGKGDGVASKYFDILGRWRATASTTDRGAHDTTGVSFVKSISAVNWQIRTDAIARETGLR
jgi:hypothetical protein